MAVEATKKGMKTKGGFTRSEEGGIITFDLVGLAIGNGDRMKSKVRFVGR